MKKSGPRLWNTYYTYFLIFAILSNFGKRRSHIINHRTLKLVGFWNHNIILMSLTWELLTGQNRTCGMNCTVGFGQHSSLGTQLCTQLHATPCCLAWLWSSPDCSLLPFTYHQLCQVTGRAPIENNTQFWGTSTFDRDCSLANEPTL